MRGVLGRDGLIQHPGQRLVLLRHLGAGGHVVVHLDLSAVLVDVAGEALHRAELHARGLAGLAEQRDAGHVRTGVLRQRRIGRKLELGEDRGEVHVAELGMEQDVAGQRAGAEAGKLRVQLQALERHPRSGLVVEVGRAVDRPGAEPALDEERAAVGDGVGAGLGAAEVGHGLGRHRPRALRLAADPERDDGADPGHEVARPVSGRCDPLDRLQVGDAGRERALAQAVVQDGLLRVRRRRAVAVGGHRLEPPPEQSGARPGQGSKSVRRREDYRKASRSGPSTRPPAAPSTDPMTAAMSARRLIGQRFDGGRGDMSRSSQASFRMCVRRRAHSSTIEADVRRRVDGSRRGEPGCGTLPVFRPSTPLASG